jgi:hypothetical protein
MATPMGGKMDADLSWLRSCIALAKCVRDFGHCSHHLTKVLATHHEGDVDEGQLLGHYQVAAVVRGRHWTRPDGHKSRLVMLRGCQDDSDETCPWCRILDFPSTAATKHSLSRRKHKLQQKLVNARIQPLRNPRSIPMSFQCCLPSNMFFLTMLVIHEPSL